MIELRRDGNLWFNDALLHIHKRGVSFQAYRLEQGAEEALLVLAVSVAIAQNIGGGMSLESADPEMDGNVPDGLRNVSIDSFELFARSVLSRCKLLSEGANLRSDFRPAGLERAVPLANLLPVTERACGKQRLLRLIAGLAGRGVADFPAVHSAPVLLHGLVREFRVCTKQNMPVRRNVEDHAFRIDHSRPRLEVHRPEVARLQGRADRLRDPVLDRVADG